MSGLVAGAAGLLVLLGAGVLVLPLRGGNGDHAHAGPGTVTVHALRQVAASARRCGEPARAHRDAAEFPPDDPDAARPAPVRPYVRQIGAVPPEPAPPDEKIAWPQQDPYEGRHRLRTDDALRHRLGTAVALALHGRPNQHCTGPRYRRPPGAETRRLPPRPPVRCDVIVPRVPVVFAR